MITVVGVELGTWFETIDEITTGANDLSSHALIWGRWLNEIYLQFGEFSAFYQLDKHEEEFNLFSTFAMLMPGVFNENISWEKYLKF